MPSFPIGTTSSQVFIERDAIHVPVVAAYAITPLSPGTPVKLHQVGAYIEAIACPPTEAVGIVDPFLPGNLDGNASNSFWVFIKPGTNVQLTHQWTAPGVPAPFVEDMDYDDGCRGCY